MNRTLRPTRWTQQIKEEQINFLHEVVEKNLEHKKAIELKDKQLCHINFFLQGTKKSYDIVISENTENVENIKQRYQQYQEQQQQEYFDREREYTSGKNNQKYI